MSTEVHEIEVGGVRVQIVRKTIKNLHLGVYPPSGRVRVAAPSGVSDDAIRIAVVRRLGWIKRQRAKFLGQPRQSERAMVAGESHYFLGRRYRLRVVVDQGAGRVQLRGGMLELHLRRGATARDRERMLLAWYRQQIRTLVPQLLDRWQPVLGVQVADWRIKRMKTKWGSCNAKAHRIWLNLELAKKPVRCLEYLVVHELAHLAEPGHNSRFIAIMDTHMPKWRARRAELNATPLGHDSWND